MNVLSREDLRSSLKRRDIAPVYVLYGPERYLRNVAAKTIADLCFGAGDFREFNETEFSLSAADSLPKALAAAQQLPMMAEKRIVRITDVRVSATGIRDTLRDEHETALAAYLARPAESSVVIFLADDFNRTRKIAGLLQRSAVVVEFARLQDAELFKWAREECGKLGAEIEERTVRHLVAKIGPDVARLTNEIRKLSTAALPDKLVTIELVDSLVPNSRLLDNFQLTSRLLAGRRAAAIQVMRKIMDDGAEPLMILGMLSYSFRRLAIAKDLMRQGASRAEVVKAVKLRYNDQEDFLAAARKTDPARLSHVLKRLAQADIAIKTSAGGGPAGARMQIEMLVCELS